MGNRQSNSSTSSVSLLCKAAMLKQWLDTQGTIERNLRMRMIVEEDYSEALNAGIYDGLKECRSKEQRDAACNQPQSPLSYDARVEKKGTKWITYPVVQKQETGKKNVKKSKCTIL